MRLSAVIVVALTAILVAAGCGGGSDGDGGGDSGGGGGGETAAAPLSQAEFVKKADALCIQGGKETESEFVAYAKENKIAKGKEPTQEQSEEVIEEIILPELRRQVEEIRGLGIPTQDQAQIGVFLNDVEDVIERGEEDPGNAVQNLNKELTAADQQIQGYFKVCGQKK